MIIAEVTLTPLGVGTSVSRYVKVAFESLKESGLKLLLTPMSTVLEANSLDEIFEAVKRAEEAMLNAGAKRVIIDLKVDHRIDKEATMEKKISAIKSKNVHK